MAVRSQPSIPTVILGNRPERLRHVLVRLKGPLRYFSLIETQESHRICTYLESRDDTEELDRATLFRQHSDEFRKQYIQFMGELNKRNHSLAWWAMPFTSKQPTSSSLCYDMLSFLLMVTLLRQDSGNLLVISDSPDLAVQVKAWARGEGFQSIVSVKPKEAWKTRIKDFTPAALVRAWLSTLYLWLRARRYRPAQDRSHGYTVVVSPSHRTSFVTKNSYSDIYFGPLVDYLGSSGRKAMVFSLFDSQVQGKIASLKEVNSSLPIVPVEACIGATDLVACGLSAFRYFITGVPIKGPVQIVGIDTHIMVRRAVREACHSGNIFMALGMYRAARRMSQRVPVERCIYPYENRPWEKMLLLGVREHSPGTRMVGYQHAAISPSHLHFFLDQGESESIPLPDILLTSGQVTRDWLAAEGHYPAGLLKAGCALRQGRKTEGAAGQGRNGKISNLLVVLGNDLEEYVRALVLIEKAFDGRGDRQVMVRPHPAMTFPLEEALRVAPLPRQDFFIPSTGSLQEALESADVVLYASSTVGVEAAAAGIPTIYMELGKSLSTDPMARWGEFKWSADSPQALVNAIHQIETIPQDRLETLRHKAREYAKAYLSPVTDGSLEQFLHA